jgi:RNA polymerase sigma factor (sigma-70 family)
MTTAHAGGLSARWDAVLEHRERALRVARARLSDPYDVDDAVQEGMARVVAMPNLDLDRIGPLLSTVVANVAIDTHRKYSRWSRLEARLTSTEVAAQVHDEPVCDAAEARWLHTQLQSLAPRERAVLELRAEGRSVAETASLLGISYKAVDSAFTRGRTALKALWRATLVVLAAATIRVLRLPPKLATAAVLAAAATLAISVLQLAPTSPSKPSTPPQPPGIAGSSYPGGEPKLVAEETRRQVGATHNTKTRAAARRVDRTTLAAVPPPTSAGIQAGRAALSRKHADESMQQTVRRCIRRGVYVSPWRISCSE